MQYHAADTATSMCERVMGRAFLVAHLLTASTKQAESVTLAALDSWNPDEEPEEMLFQHVLDNAASKQDSNRPDPAREYLPDELLAVLQLAPQLRRCFVLRILVGLPAEVCARLLRLSPRRVDQFTCAALQCLGAADKTSVDPLEAKLIA